MPKFKFCLSNRNHDRIMKFFKKSGSNNKLSVTKQKYIKIKFCKPGFDLPFFP
jgi:hypothetical protein